MQQVSSETKHPALSKTPEGGKNECPTRLRIQHSVTGHANFTEAFFTVKMSHVSKVRM
jgi:hypothetical protein